MRANIAVRKQENQRQIEESRMINFSERHPCIDSLRGKKLGGIFCVSSESLSDQEEWLDAVSAIVIGDREYRAARVSAASPTESPVIDSCSSTPSLNIKPDRG